MDEPAGNLQREIRQSKPFLSLGQEAVLGILRTADELRHWLAGLIEPHGVTLQQYNVLRILRGAGDDGLPTLEIADRMIERSPGITRLLDRLGSKGLVRRERCREDRRQMLCWITDAGRDLLAELDDPIARAESHALADMDRADVERLIDVLDRVRATYKTRPGR
jgi:DNA-binding MarR family transcriptional regulator